MVTLRYLAERESHKTLSLYFMIGRPTISKFIPKVLKAIIAHVLHIHSKVMSSESQWFEVERQLANRWDYVNPIEAIDGKHVVMIKPRSSRSTYLL